MMASSGARVIVHDSHDEGREGVCGLHVHNFLVLEVLTQHAQCIELCSAFNLVVA
jgi:hypothetical protein